MRRSGVTMVSPCTIAWAMRSRSNGSRWRSGSLPACSVASSSIASVSIRWRRRCSGDVFVRGHVQAEASQTVLDGDLPRRGCAQEHIVGRVDDRLARHRRQARIILGQPEERHGVEQEPHISSRLRRPALRREQAALRGAGRRRSRGSRRDPCRADRRGSSRRSANGRISATGRFRRQRMMQSPGFNRAMCSDRWVFASCMLSRVVVMAI